MWDEIQYEIHKCHVVVLPSKNIRTESYLLLSILSFVLTVSLTTPAPAESCKSFLRMEYSLENLHKLLKWSDNGKGKGEWSQTSLLEGKYGLLGQSLDTIRTLVLWFAHSRRYGETFDEADSCGVDFLAFPWFICSISALLTSQIIQLLSL